jgi:hypothetical protein
LFCPFGEVNLAVVQKNMGLKKNTSISAISKDPLDKRHHNNFHEELRIKLVQQTDQIHDVEALSPPHDEQHEFRSTDRLFAFYCHILAANRRLCRMRRFKIYPVRKVPGTQ